MKRCHLFEFHELECFPEVLRNLLTDFLSYFSQFLRPYNCVAELLKDAVEKSGAEVIVDLCSGAARPVLTVREALSRSGRTIPVVISDKFPNKEAFRQIEKEYGGAVTPLYKPVDATDVPPESQGFRTIFTAFHHFTETEAKKILSDAVKKRQGIGIFEYTERSLAWGIYAVNIPWVVWFLSVFIKPLTWQRVVFTYLIPVVPVLVMFDGAVSCLRTYSPEELQNLVESVELETGGCGYQWHIGQVPAIYIMRVTYLIGYPVENQP